MRDKILLASSVGIVLGMGVWLYRGAQERDRPAPHRRAQETAAPGPAIDVTAGTLVCAYNENELAADQAYRDHTLRVTGTVFSVGRDVLEHPYVAFEGGTFGVDARFQDSATGELAHLHRGQRVTVQCQGDGKTAAVQLTRCALVGR